MWIFIYIFKHSLLFANIVFFFFLDWNRTLHFITSYYHYLFLV